MRGPSRGGKGLCSTPVSTVFRRSCGVKSLPRLPILCRTESPMTAPRYGAVARVRNDVRGALLLGILGVGAYLIVTKVIARTLVQLTDRSMAILLERRYRSFADSLVTTVELSHRRPEEIEFNPQGTLAERIRAGTRRATGRCGDSGVLRQPAAEARAAAHRWRAPCQGGTGHSPARGDTGLATAPAAGRQGRDIQRGRQRGTGARAMLLAFREHIGEALPCFLARMLSPELAFAVPPSARRNRRNP